VTRSALTDYACQRRLEIAVKPRPPQFVVRRLPLGALIAGILVGQPVLARAQGFVSPMYGVNFGGVSGCPQLTGCMDQQTNVSVAAGLLSRLVALEAEVAYTPTFLGEAPGLSSKALTLMGNVMIAPEVGRLRPYMLGGLGVIRTRVELTTSSPITTDHSVLAFGVGGGVIGFVTSHFGLRVDMRYIHSFSEFTVAGLTLSSDNIDYSRASAGVVVKF